MDLLRLQSDLYWSALLGTLIIALAWEMRYPARAIADDQRQRWTLNFALLLVNQIVLLTTVPIATVMVAIESAERGLGLMNLLGLESIGAIVVSMLVMDLCKYLQHYLLHHVPLLWRIHRTHHADPECDATTSFRFHPFEIIVALLIEASVILIFGVSPIAVVLYQTVRAVVSILAHSNVSIAPGIEKPLRYVLVTPDLHRIHHSAHVNEQNCNFSGGLILWDHIFGTYIARAGVDQRTMTLGVFGYERSQTNSLKNALLDPFLSN